MHRALKQPGSAVAALLLTCLLSATASEAQLKTSDGNADDWCFGQEFVERIENSSTTLSCGACQGFAYEACYTSADCPGEVACVGSQNTEIVWWDARADAAVNDLATVAVSGDDDYLYILVELWIYPDPVSLPFIQIAFDVEPGGAHELWDPESAIKAPGTCSVFRDRGCTRDADCHFCLDSFEAPECCETGSCPPQTLCRVRSCGTGCDAGDSCDTSQSCEGLGTVPVNDIGVFSSPIQQADYLFLYDLGVWLAGGGTLPSVELRRWDGSSWAAVPASCSVNGAPCSADGDCPPVGATQQQCVTRFQWSVAPCGNCTNWPPTIELVVPWSAFDLLGFGPGQAFTYSAVISRGEFFLDFVPRGALEDGISEAAAGTTTATMNSCPGTGIGSTLCEIDDASSDAFVPGVCPSGAGEVPDGHTVAGPPLRIESLPDGNVRLGWSPSCSACDSDYAIYVRDLDEGAGGAFQPWLCSTGGSTTTTVDPDGLPDRAGLVVVPLNDGGSLPVEGGLGFESGGSRRTPSTAPCALPSIAACGG